MTLKNNIHTFWEHPISNIIVVGWIPISLFCLVFYSFLLTSLTKEDSPTISQNLAKFKLGIVALFAFSIINVLHLFFYHLEKVRNDRSLTICIGSEIAIVSVLMYRIQSLSFNSNNNEIEEAAKVNVFLILAFTTIKLFALSLLRKVGAIPFLKNLIPTTPTNKKHIIDKK